MMPDPHQRCPSQQPFPKIFQASGPILGLVHTRLGNPAFRIKIAVGDHPTLVLDGDMAPEVVEPWAVTAWPYTRMRSHPAPTGETKTVVRRMLR